MNLGSTASGVAPRAAARLQTMRLERQLDRLGRGVIDALSMLLDLNRLTNGSHATRLAAWGRRVGERLGLGERDLAEIETASVLHDVGKIAVPSELLRKPGRLTDSELQTVRRHAEYGWAVLRNIPGQERIAQIVLHHHERWDGHGYPSGLVGLQIPLGARIVAVVDTFDAMLSDRPYRKGRALEVVIEELRPEAGRQFDPEILRQFLDVAGRHADEIGRRRETAA